MTLAEVNGAAVDILVDSGASSSAVKANEQVCRPTSYLVTKNKS